jgi:glycolate oxidase
MASLADQLSLLLGLDRVSTTADDLAAHSTDKWFASNPPEVVVHAQNVDDVSKTLDSFTL